jgi:SpoVK/Ycf46/Vps4 family AAA+-type ATPase
VQFVRFKEFAGKGKELLAEHVLKEVNIQAIIFLMNDYLRIPE